MDEKSQEWMEILSANFKEVAHIFDIIFYDISPIQRYNFFKRNKSIEIPRLSLNDSQCDAIKKLSGYLTALRDTIAQYKTNRAVDAVKLPDYGTANEIAESNVENPSQTMQLQRANNLLQDYLVHELNRSEQLVHNLKAKEAELVAVTAERDRLFKLKPEAISESLTPAEMLKNPSVALNKYVRKKFNDFYYFGIVASFNHPYFLVMISCFTL